MPSGSGGGHGGGGGFSGGGHGGGHFGGGHGSSQRTTHVWGGRTYVVIGGSRGRSYYMQSKWEPIIALIGFFIFCAFMVAIGVTASLGESKSYVKQMEKDYEYYQNMISYAEEHEEYQAYGKVYRIEEFEDSGKYAIYYYVYRDEECTQEVSSGLLHYSYYIYSKDLATNMRVQSQIKIAVNEYPMTSNVDSVEWNYRDTTLQDDAEYVYCVNEISTYRVAIPIAWIVFAVLIVLEIVICKKAITSKKPGETEMNEVFNQDIMNSKENVKLEDLGTKNNYKFCQYCGVKYEKERTRCPSCGSANRD